MRTARERMLRNLASRRWKLRNPDKVKTAAQIRYRKNAAKYRKHRHDYYHSHKAECSESYKRWSRKNRSRRLAYLKLRYISRRDIQKEYDRLRYLRPENVAKRERLKPLKQAYNRSYNKQNRERALVRCYRDRALKRENLVGDLSAIIKWMKSWRTPKFLRCYWCGIKSSGLSCHGDHVIALSEGGAHSLENLCISCSTCNMKKHNKPISIWNQQITEPVLF